LLLKKIVFLWKAMFQRPIMLLRNIN
jgi:hypothetical protein